MITVIVEDGTIVENANSYASVADGDTYHEGHLYGDAWNEASADEKARALVMATRTLEATMSFNGSRASSTQSLCWPRIRAENQEIVDWFAWGLSYGFWNEDPTTTGIWGPYWASNVVPPAIRAATIETARELLKSDRTLDDPTKGIQSVGVGQGAVSVSFNASDRKKIIPDMIRMMLSPYGTFRDGMVNPKVYRI
jgi:hypothetical protein